ncbi:MAG: hypothetical protein ACREPV_04925 [Lysobacter sp.]
MKHRTRTIRIALAALLFSTAMGFGAAQVFASNGMKGDTQVSCDSWACRKECGSFGGDLGPGGPGEPLQCYCCG